ncbi:MAG TPA: pyridoxal phosphate-dependent aminotransferase [Candidatus Dormibacteraeota bacterium]|jgi:aspartate/methionine/tyrosine aminotransferase|nr:pyridoxal phosphate-dependent aminotransferase [Candidatus Dormibacteraeota bacterium]
MRFAERMDRLGTESAFEVLARARRLEAQGRSVVHLEIGEPDFATPAHIVAAAEAAIEDGYTHYTPAGGIPEVREGVARHYTERVGLEIEPGEVILTPGSKNVLMFAIFATIEPGDEVIVPDPGYPIYHSLVSFVGATPVSLPLREESGFRFDPEELRALITPRTRMLILNTPQNPTGGILTQDDLVAAARLAVEHDLLVISDEIYSQISYEAPVPSIMALPGMKERTVLMDGLSKAYAMCGWRLGIGVAPAELIRRMETLMINSSSCATAFIQIATLTALESPDSDVSVERMLAEYRRRRDVLVDGLNAIPGLRCHRPGGAFYVFPNVTGTGIGERELADRLLAEAGVAVLPGSSFGAMGKGFIRLSYAQAVPELEEALRRIGGLLAGAAA